MRRITRGEFITLNRRRGGAAAAWPLSARAQQSAMPVIGYLSARSREDTSHLTAAFQRGLAESDYIDGRNVTIEYRFALGQYDKLPRSAEPRPAEIIARFARERPAPRPPFVG